MYSFLFALWCSHPSARCCMHLGSKGEKIREQILLMTSVLQVGCHIVILGHFGEWALTRPSLHTPEKMNQNLKVLRVLYIFTEKP